MRFVVIEMQEGGAEEYEYSTKEEVQKYLDGTRYWFEAASTFRLRTFVPGDMLNYPCGWVFAIN